MRLRYGRPLGPHPALVEVVDRRLDEAGARPGDPVVLVAGGALDPDANAQVAAHGAAAVGGAGLGVGRRRVRQHDPADGARGPGPAAPRSATTRVAVARYFLGPGRLPRLVERAATGVAGLEVVVERAAGRVGRAGRAGARSATTRPAAATCG